MRKDRINSIPVIPGTFININGGSDSRLGKRLSIGYPFSIKTSLGTAGSVKNFMDYLTRVNYPVDLLCKLVMTHKDRERISKETIRLINYNAILFYILAERIYQDPDLRSDMFHNTLPYTAFKKTKDINPEYLPEGVTAHQLTIPDTTLAVYIKHVKTIEYFIKRHNFNRATIDEYVNSLLVEGTTLFEGTRITLG